MKGLLWLGLVVSSKIALPQSVDGDTSLITVHGRVVDTVFNTGFYDVVVLNKSAGKGIFGSADGTFSITLRKSDQLGVSVVGYHTIYLSFKDSSFRSSYRPVLFLQPLSFTGSEVVVNPLKTLEQLKKERAAIAKREVAVVTSIDVIKSPITALYMAFSKRERTKRKIAEMDYRDKQREVVRELLRLYVHHDIVALSPEDFEAFITFIHLSDTFLKTATDYELIRYIQEKFEHFQRIEKGF